MSVHKCLYLGPYVECTYKPATRVRDVWGCTLPECKRHPKKIQPDAEGKFCSTCGMANGKIPIQVNDRPDRYDVVGDELFQIESSDPANKDVLWLAPNVRRKGDPRPKWDDDGEIHLDLVNANPQQEMDWFEKAFAKELEKLRKVYATVTVCWGLHQYFM